MLVFHFFFSAHFLRCFPASTELVDGGECKVVQKAVQTQNIHPAAVRTTALVAGVPGRYLAGTR